IAGDYYSPSIHVTATGGIGISVSGLVHVRTLAEWHSLACEGMMPNRRNFDDELVFAAKVGEETGSTAGMLEGISCLLEEDAYDLIKKTVSFIEPAATLLSGAAVAFIALSVFSPITKILASIQ
ncbi:MAG: type II secretion system F family protein, partial [Candidatus Margulisiibacteriota bacterium]